jgi:dTMP kinase
MQGLFITVEGGEGAGKSTQMERISNWLEAAGHTVVRTREPGGTKLAESLRDVLLDRENQSLCSKAELLLLFAARAQHLDEKIRPALGAGQTVLCDRFTDATWAYQGGGRGLPRADIAALEKLVHGDLQPALTLLLDIPVEEGMQRVARRGVSDRFEEESVAFFERVRLSYLERASDNPERFAVIDATHDEDGVWKQIKQVLEERAAQ